MNEPVKFIKFSCDSDQYLSYLNSENRKVLHEEVKDSLVLTHIYENGLYHWAFNYCDNNGYLNELSYNGNLMIQHATEELQDLFNNISEFANSYNSYYDDIEYSKNWVTSYNDLREKLNEHERKLDKIITYLNLNEPDSIRGVEFEMNISVDYDSLEQGDEGYIEQNLNDFCIDMLNYINNLDETYQFDMQSIMNILISAQNINFNFRNNSINLNVKFSENVFINFVGAQGADCYGWEYYSGKNTDTQPSGQHWKLTFRFKYNNGLVEEQWPSITNIDLSSIDPIESD